MGLGEIEELAEWFRWWCGVTDPEEIVSPIGLLQRKLGRDAVRKVPRLRSKASLSRWEGRRFVAIRDGMPEGDEEHHGGHECGHLAGELTGVKMTERDCHLFAAALMMPRGPFLARARARTWPQLALDFGATQTAVALRLAETTERAIAVLTPARIHARGQGWADDATVREWARIPRKGIARARISDAKGRIALILGA